MRLFRSVLTTGVLLGSLLVSGVAFADVPSTGGGGAAATGTGGGATTSGTGGSASGSGGGGSSGGDSSDDGGCAVSRPGDSVAAGTMTALAVLALAIAGGSRRKSKKPQA